MAGETTSSDARPSVVSVALDYAPRLNLALQQNAVPVVQRLSVTNDGAADLVDLEIEVRVEADGVLTRPWSARLDRLPAGSTHRLVPVDLAIDARGLRNRSEREDTELVVVVRPARSADATAEPGQGDAVGSTVASPPSNPPWVEVRQPLAVLAFDEWGGIGTFPDLLVAFVQPNHPRIQGLLARAAARLGQATGDPSLDGYQSRSRERVVAIVTAIYRAVCDCEIVYAHPPASFEQGGQRVRSPAAILRHRLATCLDLAVLFASVFEQAGLHALVLLHEGHAAVGVWLTGDSFDEPTIDDAVRVKKRVQLGEMLAIETTGAVAGDARPVEAACEQALRDLANTTKFQCAVDVAAARRAGVRPLPAWDEDRVVEAVGDDAEPATAPATSGGYFRTSADDGGGDPVDEPRDVLPGAYDASLDAARQAAAAADSAGPTRVERWKRKLLDLTFRNRLINYRDTRRSVPLLTSDLGSLEDALASAGGASFVILPRPAQRSKDAEEKPDGSRDAVVARDLERRRLRADLDEKALDARLVELWRAARTSVEESGANSAYLALGFLSYFESESSDVERRAPILLLPLEIDRRSVRDGVEVRLADEDCQVNVTLLEKLAAEFPLDVTGLDLVPEDDAGIDVTEVLQRFRRLIRDIDRWDVVEEAAIATFSFTKFLMWRDLQAHADVLMKHRLVQRLLARSDEVVAVDDGEFPDAERLDETLAPVETLCPLDADSSQLAAIVAARSGASFVLEGPPGTGKSQTITNLIAWCLGEGKRVLFVAEKRAALQVVFDRLERVGLGAFCLELHSNKTSKREVVDQLVSTFDAAGARSPSGWKAQADALATRRDELNRLVDALHRPRAVGDSVFRVTSKLVGLGDGAVVELAPGAVDAIDAAWLDTARQALDRAGTALAAVVGTAPIGEHPLRAVRRTEWTSTLAGDVEQASRSATGALGSLRTALVDLLETTGEAADAASFVAALSRRQRASFVQFVAAMIEPPATPTRSLLTDGAWRDVRAEALGAIEEGRQADVLAEHVATHFDLRVLDLDLDRLHDQLRRGLSSWPPLSWLRRWRGRRALRAVAIQGHLGSTEELVKHVEDAIELRSRRARLAAPEHAGTRWFGTAWSGGDGADWDVLTRLVDWAEGVRRDGRSLADAGAVGAALRARCEELVCDRPDELAAETRLGARLRDGRDAARRFDDTCTAVERVVDLDVDVAWGADEEPASFAAAERTLDGLAAHARGLDEWCLWQRARRDAVDAGLESLVEACERDDVEPAALPEVFERSFFTWWLDATVDGDDELRAFYGREHDRKIHRFAELDRALLDQAAAVVKARLASELPRFDGRATESSELGVLQRQARLKRRHLPVRKLLARLPNLLPRLKPCFLMSPLSVAQYLDPAFPPFDLVVFDEASQIPPWDAIGAVARGASCVVVGDSKQLPPTTFFQREAADDDVEFVDDPELEELESILDEFLAAGLPPRQLRWHYRSRHESLIAFSNWHYYDNRLITFPAPVEHSTGLGVSLRHFDEAVYDRARSRTNRVEAEAVVAELVAMLKRDDAASRSLGVVTLSLPQQVLVEDLADKARREHPEIDRFFTDAVDEPVFVKNLENVQGDERDVILFSVCYGPDATGKVSMNFGPLNRNGGERRLNVAITRAREQVVVFTGLAPERIDLSRTRAVGAAHLKTLLEYASRGPAALAEASRVHGDGFDSPFEQFVHDALVARGWQVDTQVGCSGYRIDLAVRHPDEPGRWVLGVECDGASYHSAKTARDRDRLRGAVLEAMGWRLHRVWSTDWWRHPERELERIERTLAEVLSSVATPAPADEVREAGVEREEPVADERADDVAALAGSVDADEVDETGDPAEPGASAEPDDSSPSLPEPSGPTPYVPLLPDEPLGDADGFFAPTADAAIADVLRRVVAAEAPIAAELAWRRVDAFWAIGRTTSRVRARCVAVAERLATRGELRQIGAFLWSADQDPRTWRGFRVPATEAEPPPRGDGLDAARITASRRDADELPVEEVANAAGALLRQQISLPPRDLAREVARVFGFTRLGSKLETVMLAGIDALVARGEATRQGDTVAVVAPRARET